MHKTKEMIENRIALLSSRQKENFRIVQKLQRQLRKFDK